MALKDLWEDQLDCLLALVVLAKEEAPMDMPRKIRCGLPLKLNNLHSTRSQATHLMDLSNHHISNNLLTSHLLNFVIPEAIRKCRQCSSQACRAWVKATLHQAKDFIQIEARSNSCKQQLPVLSQELRAGHHNNLQDQAGRGAGRDSRNDTSVQE